jgi:hypothetical protein
VRRNRVVVDLGLGTNSRRIMKQNQDAFRRMNPRCYQHLIFKDLVELITQNRHGDHVMLFAQNALLITPCNCT